MKKVIVTGANGFIGSHLVKELVDNRIHVLAIGRPGRNNNLSVSDFVQFMSVNVFELREHIHEFQGQGYDTFFHLAWEGSAGVSRADYDLQMKNALCTVECIKVAKQIGCRRFVCAGSIMEKEAMAVLNEQGSHPGMGYIYGIGKLAAHCMGKSVAASEDIEFIWGVITNAYGEGELSPRFVNTTLRKVISGETLKFTAATQNYDFIHVDDAAKAFRLIGEYGKPFCEYVIGSGDAKPLKNFIAELKESLAPESELVFGDIPFTGVNMPLEAFSTEQTENDCGFRPEISFSDGIKRTMEWLREADKYDREV